MKPVLPDAETGKGRQRILGVVTASAPATVKPGRKSPNDTKRMQMSIPKGPESRIESGILRNDVQGCTQGIEVLKCVPSLPKTGAPVVKENPDQRGTRGLMAAKLGYQSLARHKKARWPADTQTYGAPPGDHHSVAKSGNGPLNRFRTTATESISPGHPHQISAHDETPENRIQRCRKGCERVVKKPLG